MAPTRPNVFTVDEYDALEFDAVLFRSNTVVCLDGTETARIVPLDKVNHVDADPETMLVEREIPDTFYGGGDYGFVNVEKYPELQQHLDELEAEQY